MTEIFRRCEAVSDIFPFGEEFARVEVNPNALRRDFMDAAVEQGVDASWAWEFSVFTNFAFQNFGEFPEQYRDVNVPLWMKALDKIPDISLVGITFSNGRDALCFINIKKIVKRVSEGNTRPNLKMPREISEEARRAAVSQTLNKIWSHERQHLIQDCQPDAREKRLKEKTCHARVLAIAIAGYLIGNGLVIVSSHVPENLWLATRAVGTSSVLASVVTLTGLALHRSVWSSREKEAQREAKMATGAGPFKVSFEK